jgi:NAD(P) transhydrogenase subunit alpha
MNTELLTDLTIFALAVLVGFEVISKVPATLHTPLMSGANAIHGVVLIGAMVITATCSATYAYVLAAVAMAFAAMNVVGGSWSPTGCCTCSAAARQRRLR